MYRIFGCVDCTHVHSLAKEPFRRLLLLLLLPGVAAASGVPSALKVETRARTNKRVAGKMVLIVVVSITHGASGVPGALMVETRARSTKALVVTVL